jgi:hypothetical protein
MLKNSFLRLFYSLMLVLQTWASIIILILLAMPIFFVFGPKSLYRFFKTLVDALIHTINKIPN